MNIYCTGTARIRHAETGVEYTIESSDLDWDMSGGEDRSMGPEYHYNAQMEHPELGVLSWYVAEYPVGAENMKETDVGPHQLLTDFDYGLGATPDIDTDITVDDLVEWFRARYEDPAERLPYISAEGGYQWIWGGPYDAREVLSEQFTGVDEDIIEAAVQEIESDGLTDWAPQAWLDDEPKDDRPDWDELDTLFDQLRYEIPPQGPGIQFHITEGQIVIAPPASVPDGDPDEVADLRSACVVIAETLVQSLQGSNAHVSLRVLSENYAATLNADPFSIDLLYAGGVRLENQRARTLTDIKSGDLPPLNSDTEEALNSLLEMHAVIITSSSRGRELLDRARDYARTDAETKALRNEGRRLADVVQTAPALFPDDVRDLIKELNENIGAGPHPERSTDLAVSTNRNLLITIATALGAATLSTVVFPGIGASAPGTAAITGVADLTDIISTFVASNITVFKAYAAVAASDMSWFSSMCHAIEYAMTTRSTEDSKK